MSKVALLGKRKGFSQGQALSEKFNDVMGYNPRKGQKLGEIPLVVTEYSPGIRVRVDDPLKELWRTPGDDAGKWLNEALSKSVDTYDMVDKFLDGAIQLRSTVWKKDNGREIQFLTNKPYRAVITVILNDGEHIALKNLNEFPYVLSKEERRD